MAVPWAMDQPTSVVDLDDVAEVAVKVLSEEGHLRAIYDLVGDEPLSTRDMAEIVSKVTGRSLEAQQVPTDKVTQGMARDAPAEAYEADSLERMFVYYTRHGLTGSPNVLRFVLGRPLTTYEAFVRKSLNG